MATRSQPISSRAKMAAIQSYTRVGSIQQALAQMQRAAPFGNARLLAGGTDLLPQVHSGRAPGAALVDVSDVPELQGISADGEQLRIGAATKLADIVRSPFLTGGLRVLADSAAQVGSVQVRHLATLGGNLCNASPSADTAPALLVLDAVVAIVSQAGERRLPLDRFFVGPGRTALQPGELLAAILLPGRWREGAATYLKHAPRAAMDLAVVGVAAAFSQKPNGSPEVRLALGAVAPTPIRARRAEAQLLSAPAFDEQAIREAAACAAAEASPISDVRASAAYRRAMAALLVERALRLVLRGESIEQGRSRAS